MAGNIDASRLLGKRAPEATGIDNTPVPHIGAQRRESQGDNYRRKASAFGRLSSALEGFGAAFARQQATEKDDGDLLTSLASNQYSSEVRHEASVDTGREPVLESIETADDWQARGAPWLEQKWRDKLAQYNKDGWKTYYKEGDELPVSDDGYQAKVGDIKDVIRPEDIADEIIAESQGLRQRFEGNTTVKRKLRDAVGRQIKSLYAEADQALSTYRRKERTTRFENVYQNQGASMVLDPANGHLSPDDLVKNVDAYGKQLADEVNADLSDPMSRHKALLRGLDTAMDNVNTDKPVSDEDILAANATLKYLQGQLPNTGQSSLTHQQFSEKSTAIARRAKDVLARRAYDIAVQKRKAELYKLVIEQRNNPKFADLDPIKIKGGFRVFTAEDKDIVEDLARERDTRANQSSTGQALDVGPDKFWGNIVDEQRGSAVDSPALKNIFTNFSMTTAMADGNLDGREMDAIFAYDALKKKSPFDLGRYIPSEDRKAFETIYMLSGMYGLSLRETAQMYMDRSDKFKQGGFGDKGNPMRKIITNEVKDERFPDNEVDAIADAVAYSFLGTPHRPSDKEIRQRTRSIMAIHQTSVPEINGQRTQMPQGKGMVFATNLQTYLNDSAEFKRFGLKPDQYSMTLTRDNLRYQLLKPDGISFHQDKNGRPLYVTVDEVEDWASAQAQAAVEARDAANKQKIKDENERIQQEQDKANFDFQTAAERRNAVKEFYRQRNKKIQEGIDKQAKEPPAARAPTWSATGPSNYRRPTGKDVIDALEANKPDISVTPRPGPKYKAGDSNYRMPNKADVDKAIERSKPKGDKTPKWRAGQSNYRLPKIGN